MFFLAVGPYVGMVTLQSNEILLLYLFQHTLVGFMPIWIFVFFFCFFKVLNFFCLLCIWFKIVLVKWFNKSLFYHLDDCKNWWQNSMMSHSNIYVYLALCAALWHIVEFEKCQLWNCLQHNQTVLSKFYLKTLFLLEALSNFFTESLEHSV